MARSFNGTTQYADGSTDLTVALPLTLACRYYSTATGGIGFLLSDHTIGDLWSGYGINCDSGNVFAASANTFSAFQPGGVANGLNVWAHVAGVFNATNNRVCYTNGQPGAADTTAITQITTVRPTLAACVRPPQPPDNFAAVRLADVAAWNVALSAGEIAALAGGVSPLRIRPLALILYYPLFGSGSPEPDYSGSGKHLTLFAAPAVVDHAPVMSPFGADTLWTPVSPLAAGSFSVVGPGGSATLPSNHPTNIVLTLSGSGTSWGGTTVFTVAGAGVTKVSQSVTSTTSATLTVTTSASTGVCTVTETVTGSGTSTISVAAASFTPLPNTIPLSSTGQVIALTGTNTLWAADTPTFSLSGGTGASKTAQSITDNTHASVTLSAGSSVATLTLTDPSTGATTTVSVTLAQATATTLSGPNDGASGVASSAFTVGLGPAGSGYNQTVTVTPHDGGDGGTFTPTSNTLTANVASPTATFTYTPAGDGVVAIYTTNNRGLADPISIDYTSPTPVFPSGGPVLVWPDMLTAAVVPGVPQTLVVTRVDVKTGLTVTVATVLIPTAPTVQLTDAAAGISVGGIAVARSGGA